MTFGRVNWILAMVLLIAPTARADAPRSYSGVYPHLAFFNDEAECGTGAVVPWAGRLWAITYGPHLPNGSSDKLYEITSDLRQIIRPESVGGTHASRMIHAESQQLFIGPYAINRDRTVRGIPPSRMPGRLTGTARHLTDPASKVYYATMEEGFYEVDVNTLAVREIYPDANARSTTAPANDHAGALLPGYHGKGLYSGQGRLIYANNGEISPEARLRPDIQSGALAEWDGRDWSIILRNQFTDVTGPGGIHGNPNPATDPIWSIGWDHRSLILMLRERGAWHRFRLPRGSHAYDGAHGWNTEWPRIREIGDDQPLLMTMHGLFWRFPRTFSTSNSAGIAPRSAYLKVIGDFCRWGDRIVLGCDDTAKNEFLNQRRAKGGIAGPGQSQSNLWFLPPDGLDHLGPALGRGAVWLDEPVVAGVASDPFTFEGFDRRGLHLAHAADHPVTFTLEANRNGDSHWTPLKSITLPPRGYQWIEFGDADRAAWVRITADRDCPRATAFFSFANDDPRPATADPIFRAVLKSGHDPARAPARASGGLLHARGQNQRTLQVGAVRIVDSAPAPIGSYELDADMVLRPMSDPAADRWLRDHVAVPTGVLRFEPSSVLYVDDAGRRWRLPRAPGSDLDPSGPFGPERIDREVATERDLFNAAGIFYELPAENAGGFAKIRPISTHNRRIHDYASWRGLLVLTGIADAQPGSDADDHVIRSADGRCAVWVGAVDDLWKFGKPTGVGGPWLETAVKKTEPSDAYLMTGFDIKTLTLSHRAADPVAMRVEVDISGTGNWQRYRTIDVPPGKPFEHAFPRAFAAYWVRIVCDADCIATAQLIYQ